MGKEREKGDKRNHFYETNMGVPISVETNPKDAEREKIAGNKKNKQKHKQKQNATNRIKKQLRALFLRLKGNQRVLLQDFPSQCSPRRKR